MDPADETPNDQRVDQRANELEMKVTFLEDKVAELSTTLAREVREHLALQERVGLLEKALQVLAQRNAPRSGGGGDDVGADSSSDPVPHSG
ncbi:MAG: SlyX family protein [Deltaproteobacteria bacterium]|nr:SlyX family protein [Deltaproteobacteria bacterium]